jgi:predicted ribosomally synthesized peptide with nif11-like leader
MRGETVDAHPRPKEQTMSQEAVNRFIARLGEDEAFRKEVFATEVGEDRLAYVNGESFDLSAQELVDATAELTDADLNAVQGGRVLAPPDQGLINCGDQQLL